MTKLTIQQVRDIKFGNASPKVLRDRHHVTQHTIYEIRTGLTWRDVKPVVKTAPLETDAGGLADELRNKPD